MKNRIIYFLSLFILLGCSNGKMDTSMQEEEKDKEMEPSVEQILAVNPRISIGKIQKRSVNKDITATGIIELPPTEIISIHSRSEGFIRTIKYIPGDYVRKGSFLFSVFNNELVIKQRILLETKAELFMAEKDFLRKEELMQNEATTQKAFDESLGNKQYLEAKYSGLKKELELLGINVEKLEKDGEFQTILNYYAPNAGYIHKVNTNIGQRIRPEDEIMEIANNEHMHLELHVLSKDVPFLRIGQKVTFSIPNNGEVFGAEVHKINPMLESETSTLNVHCHLDNDGNKLIKPGMFANAIIKLETQDIFGLPIEALIKEGVTYYAYIVSRDKFEKKPIKNPILYDDFIAFDTTGYSLVVTSGAYYIE